MSTYQTMDHAGWVEENNKAANSMYGKRKGYRPAPEKLTEFQAKVMDICGMVFGGIYNAPIRWETVEWRYGSGGLSLKTGDHGFATFDFSKLTSLVFLCHEARIRCEIEASANRYFRLSFWQRQPTGAMHDRHPNLEEAVNSFRAYLPVDHRIIYRAPATEEAA